MEYETGKKLEEHQVKIDYLFNMMDKAGLIPKEDKKTGNKNGSD